MIITKETTTDHYKALSNILGKRYIKSEIMSNYDFIDIAEKGISARVILNFRKQFNLSREFTAEMLNVSVATIYRWIRENKKMPRNHSIQLMELADLFLYGTEVFEDRDNFLKWLKLPNKSLGGKQPQELLELPGGVSKIRDLLGKIEHSVYS